MSAGIAGVLGGITLTGGSGSMLHVVYGCVILVALSNSMTLVGVSSYDQILVTRYWRSASSSSSP